MQEDSILEALPHLSIDSNLDIFDYDTKLLRLAAQFVFKSLCYLVNVSLKTGVILDDWKFARTTPIYKGKGCKKTMGNYRPIPVVCHVAKVFEKEVQVQLLNYLTTHDMITVDQCAVLKRTFHPNLSSSCN